MTAKALDGLEARDPVVGGPRLEERTEDGMWPVFLAGLHECDRQLGANAWAGIARQPIGFTLDRRRIEDGKGPDGGRPHPGIGVATCRLHGGPTTPVEGELRESYDPRAAHGRILVLEQAHERVNGLLRPEAAQEVGRQAADARARVRERRAEVLDHPRVTAKGAETGAAFEHLFGKAGPKCAHQRVRITPPDLEHHPRQRERSGGAKPEHVVRRQEGAGRDQEQPGQGDAELSWNAVVEGQHLRPPFRGHGVVEGTPRRVRQPALRDLLREPENDRRCERELDDPQAEPGQVYERQQQRRRSDPEPCEDAVGQRDRNDERGGRHRRGQQAERGRQVGLRPERARDRTHEGERHREVQDGEEQIRDGHESHEGRSPHVVVAGAQLGRQWRAFCRGSRGPGGDSRSDPGRDGCRDGEEGRVREEQVLGPRQPGERPRRERSSEATQDRGARAERKEALGLPCIKERAAEGPHQRDEHRAQDVHGEPRHRENQRGSRHECQPEDHQNHHEAAEEPHEERSQAQPADCGPVAERNGEAHEAEEHVQVWESAGAEAAQEEGVGADLAEPACGLDCGEHGRDQRDQWPFAGPDRQELSQPFHGVRIIRAGHRPADPGVPSTPPPEGARPWSARCAKLAETAREEIQSCPR